MPFDHPYLSGHGFACFAHRGGALENPENTKQAFSAATALGYRFIETDVQATADGVVLVFHDGTLERMTDGTGTISDLPFSEVRQARIDGTEPIVTLEEALTEFPETHFNIDIKTDHALEPTLELIARMNCLDRVCLASFSDARLRTLRKRFGARVCSGAGPRDVSALKFGSWGVRTSGVSANCAQVPIRQYGVNIVASRFLGYCNAQGVAVHVWTIDEEAEMRRLIRLGVNGIMSDRPSLLKRVAQEEGVW
ncbi:MAG: glycerophosphodiester phosphodiesterase [Hyphomicrobiales bacterium]